MSVVTYLESGLLVNGLLLLGAIPFLLLNFIENVHSDTELVSQPIDPEPLRTNNSTDKLPVNLKFCRLKYYARVNGIHKAKNLNPLT